VEPLIELQKKCASSYFYFAHVKKDNQIPLSPLIIGKQEVYYKKRNFGNPILPMDS